MKKEGGILIIAEIDNNNLHNVTFELLGKGKELKTKTGYSVECLVIGKEGLNLEELYKRGADKVYYIGDKAFKDKEEILYKKNIVEFLKIRKHSIVLFPATRFGRSLAPRVAAALETGLTADCTELNYTNENGFVQIRPAFSDNILAHIKTEGRPQIATIRYKEFEEAKIELDDRAVKAKFEKCPESKIERLLPFSIKNEKCRIIESKPLGALRITDAEVIVSGGRGIKESSDLAMLKELADILGGQVGVSRALVDAGLAPASKQVGYSGNRVKPKIYIACGISGAPQHLAGMKESDKIIAINSDPTAPIFQIADIGYVGDIYEIIPKLINSLKINVDY